MANRLLSDVEESITQGLNMIPDFYVVFLAALSHILIGTKRVYFFPAAARIHNVSAEISGNNACLAMTFAEWQRRKQEWPHQLNVTEIEIEQIKRQQLAATRSRLVSLTEVNIHQRQLEHSDEVLDFLRDRTSKHELYSFMQQEMAALSKQTFKIALEGAKEAQAALWYKLGDFSACLHETSHLNFEFSENVLWNSLHEGLVVGEKLELRLHSLERRYMKANCQEYKLTKHIFPRQFPPWAFPPLKLGEKGELEIPEWWFDLDYSRHYMRRLKQVSISLACTAVRTKPLLPPAPECCWAKPVVVHNSDSALRTNRTSRNHKPVETVEKSGTEKCVDLKCGSRSNQVLLDSYVLSTHYTSYAHMAIATSTSNSDPSLFDSGLDQSRYLPLEFAGAASRWRVSLPSQNNAFSLDTE
ncbi:insecticidal toxin complex protein [Glarea lozoyensis ATCC 20868]|uniref:Insecticidal toxin complex protein n=1 Tax=Glarea lozoyensis (strain ATCC 20868 / MF5171) TaxID=1116229 RepID=S3DDL7_GLAL2|nr:insecticidal toxin complex protein [Glarea lozoyensis ATCC 20868]EPE35199.1 insecticidal toxin complex protein [Glarea lozoyensis ATCC 20868]